MNEYAALKALETYTTVRGEKDTLETDTVDLVTDLLHLINNAGIDGESVLRMAQNHFEEERK